MSFRYARILSVLAGLSCGGGDSTEPPPPPTALAFSVEPSSAAAGAAISPAVRVVLRDAQGNVAAAAFNSVTLTLNGGVPGATLSGTTTAAAVGGVATFSDLRITKAGFGYSLTATATGLTSTTSGPFSITPAAASKLVIETQPANVEGAQPIAPAVRVRVEDAFENVVSDAANAISLAIGTNPGEGTVFGSTTATPQSGVASFTNVRIDRPGTGYTLVASAPGLTSATSAAFNVTLTFAHMSAGGPGHSCGVTADRVAYCWGSNSHGQLGDGTTTTQTRPTMVAGGLTLASISAGSRHTCALTTTGDAYCWGQNEKGQLGDGGTTQRSVPTPVSGGFRFISLSAGDLHTCGITTANGASCWGFNADGQLGDGTRTDRSSPTPVLSIGFASSIYADSTRSCALNTSGAAFCWGKGYVGNGGTVSTNTTPVSVADGRTYTELALGVDHTCGLASDGRAYCWGAGGNAQIGDGGFVERLTPTAVSGSHIFRTISAGWYHTCGVTQAATAYCWGYNANHQLGDGSTTERNVPVPVGAGIQLWYIDGARYHTCGVTTAGVGYCWGNNQSGQVGDATRTERGVPTRVAH